MLPRAPLGYDPFRHRPEALARRTHVLDLMEKHGWIDGVGRAAAESETLVLSKEGRRTSRSGQLVPQMVEWVATTDAAVVSCPTTGERLIVGRKPGEDCAVRR